MKVHTGLRSRANFPVRLRHGAAVRANLRKHKVEVLPIIFAIVVPVLMFVISSFVGSSAILGRLILTLALVPNVYLLVYSLTTRDERIFAILFCLYNVQFLIVPGMVQAASGWFPFFTSEYSDWAIALSALMVLVYSGAFFFAYFLFDTSRSGAPEKKSHDTDFDVAKTVTALGVWLAVAAVSFMSFGPAKWLTRMGDAFGDVSPITLIVDNLGRVSGFLSLSLALILLVTARSPDRRIVFAVLSVVGMVAFYLLVNPVNVTRFLLFGFLIALFYSLTNSRARVFKVVLMLLLTIGATTVFPFVSELSRGEIGASIEINPFDYYIHAGDLDGLQSIMNVFEMTSAHGLTLGSHLLSDVLFFVPRDVWATKTYATGVDAAAFKGYTFTNISSPFPSELYVDFGWLGVVIGSVALAFVFVRLESWIEQFGRSAYLRRLFIGLMAGFVIIVLRGPLLGVVGVVLYSIVLCYLTFLLCRKYPPKENGSSLRVNPQLGSLRQYR